MVLDDDDDELVSSKGGGSLNELVELVNTGLGENGKVGISVDDELSALFTNSVSKVVLVTSW